MALKKSEDVFDLLQTLPKRPLLSKSTAELDDLDQHEDFDANENVLQTQEDSSNQSEVPRQEEAVDQQSIL